MADAAGVTVAEALREGAREWLLDRQPMALDGLTVEVETTVTYDDANAYAFALGSSVLGEIIGGPLDGAPVRFGPPWRAELCERCGKTYTGECGPGCPGRDEAA